MKVTINNKPHSIKFWYVRTERETVCGLFSIDKDGVLKPTGFVGIAKQHPNDRFVKALGRKLALQRLLDNANIHPEDRGDIWHTYLSTHKII